MHSSRMRTVCCSGRLGGGGVQEGVCVSGGVCIPACNGADTPLWTELLTHACENSTFPQLLLQIVKMAVSASVLLLFLGYYFLFLPKPIS